MIDLRASRPKAVKRASQPSERAATKHARLYTLLTDAKQAWQLIIFAPFNVVAVNPSASSKFMVERLRVAGAAGAGR